MNRNERRESDRLFAPTAEEIAEVEYWRSMIRYGRAPAGWRSSGREARTSGVQGTGAPVASQMIGNLGSFVPNEFFTEFMPRTMRAHDAIFDPDVVTYIKTTHGRPIQVPFISDVENVATVITEGIQDIQIDPAQVISGTIVQAWAYRTPFWGISIEALEDLEESFTAIELFKAFASDRIARGVGRDFINGDGNGKPLGIITALQNLGVTPIIAAGARGSVNSNTTEPTRNAANSIGSVDLANLFFSVEEPYRESDKCRWLMNDATLQVLNSQTNNSGAPLVQIVGGFYDKEKHIMFGKKVEVCPTMQSIGPGNISVLFGDFRYCCVRHAGDGCSIQVRRELPGFVENGLVALFMRDRYDMKYLFNDSLQLQSPATGANSSPLRFLQHPSNV